MTKKYIARKDRKLLVHAKLIFGNVVEEAYKASNAPPREDLVNEYLDFDVHYNKVLKELDYSGNEIVLKFSSGKYVCFSNSEWAQISAVDIEDVKVYD
jgi:hypothetical protein